MATRALREGDVAPAFTLRAGDGTAVRLAQFRGQRVILYFYPRDNTPGCTKEACGFQKAAARLTRQHAVVLGVSCDSPASHQRFSDTYGLAFPLLSDPDAAVCNAYGVYKQKSNYGRTYWGIERTTFLIDERGRIATIFPKVRVEGHVEAVLDALATQGRGAAAAARGSS